MKFLLIALIIVTLFFCGCRKTSSTTAYSSTAYITGPDYGMTMCRGGYFIKIDTVTTLTRFSTLPASSGIDLATATFPIHVRLNWHYQTSPDPCGIIVIDAIAAD